MDQLGNHGLPSYEAYFSRNLALVIREPVVRVVMFRLCNTVVIPVLRAVRDEAVVVEAAAAVTRWTRRG